MKTIDRYALCLGLLGCFATHASAWVFDQLPTLTPTAAWRGPISDIRPEYGRAVDNFRLGAMAQVMGVSWQGNYTSSTDFWNVGDTVSFQVDFFTGTSSVPVGVPLASYSVGAVVTGETVFLSVFEHPFAVYQLHATLPESLSLPASSGGSSAYWVSIAETDGTTAGLFDRWEWRIGRATADGGASLAGFAVETPEVAPGTWHSTIGDPFVAFQDAAFRLEGSQVPEPATMGLVTGTLAALFAAGRRVLRRESN